ncbi:MAG TPA: hypothetical protein H9736_01080 [Candidatus Anaerotruncus excrementipullorum]|uniref:CN hydrolase domain-containing protein n=1 Tax=Candidatus Anaerotruncus excrementipullorum TaxID=2838465 RepID=A0A9D1WPR3_9FIRM|nr:hypothetical protein [Candidatus Anaerotruncus excrementipullorum]
MDLFAAELLPPFQPPSNPEVQLAVFAEEGVHEQLGETGEYLSRCAHYAIRHKLYLVTGLFCYDGALCLCLLGPDGMPVLRQGALCLPPRWAGLRPADRLEVAPTRLGSLCLCPGEDILHPQVARTAALKGADLLLAVQRLDPAAETPCLRLFSAWDAAQTNNLYVVHYAAGKASVCCPAGVTRAGDGWLVRPTGELPVRFGLNMARLDEVRGRLQLLEGLNPHLAQRYAGELGRCGE